MEYLDKQNEAWKIDEKEEKEEKEKPDKKKEAGKIEEEEKEDQLVKFFSDDTIHKKVFCLQLVKSISKNGIFHHWRVTDKTFQLVRSVFSFHVEKFFLLGELKASL